MKIVKSRYFSVLLTAFIITPFLTSTYSYIKVYRKCSIEVNGIFTYITEHPLPVFCFYNHSLLSNANMFFLTKGSVPRINYNVGACFNKIHKNGSSISPVSPELLKSLIYREVNGISTAYILDNLAVDTAATRMTRKLFPGILNSMGYNVDLIKESHDLNKNIQYRLFLIEKKEEI